MSGSAMQIDKLDGENFSSWSVQMRSLLVTLDHWHVIESVKDENLSASDKAAWEKTDSKALAMLTLCVKPSELIHLKGCTTSKAAWETLNSTYKGKGPARKVKLFKQLVRFQFKAREKLSNQINEFCSIVDALNEIDVQIPSDLVSILLLCSLPDEMENFVVAIESRDSLPSLSQLKIKIFEEEHRRGDKYELNEQVFTIKHKVQKKSQQSTSNNNEKRNRRIIKCYGCGMRGHVRSQCRKESSNQAHSNAVVLSACIQNQRERNINNWILDSGASSHMCSNKKLFSSLKKHSQKVFMASGDNVETSGIGHVTLKSEYTEITLTNVLYVPDLNSNFLSVSKIINNGFCVKFTDNKAFVNSKENKLIFVACLQNGIYSTEMRSVHETAYNACPETDFITWHKRFGHLNVRDLHNMSKKEMVRHLSVNEVKNYECITCAMCKITAKPFNKYNKLFTSSVLDVVHSDICGPFRVASQGGSVYVITFIDDFSRYITTYFLKKKSDAYSVLKEFVATSEKQTGKKLKCIRTDNGREYVNAGLDNYFKENGIIHQRTASYTPQQNGVAERANRTLIEMARCMLEESRLPQYLWSEAVNTATYIRNRSSTKLLKDKTPYECWFGYKPSVSHMRVFGCDVVALLKQPGRSKLAPKGIKLSFVGYATHTKGYRLYDKNNRSIVISRDVTFFENIFSASECHTSKYQATNSDVVFYPDSYRDLTNESLTEGNVGAHDSDFNDDDDDKGTNDDAGPDVFEDAEDDDVFDAVDDAVDDAALDDDDEIFSNEAKDDNGRVSGKEDGTSKSVRGRPRILRTGNPGRPRKVSACRRDVVNKLQLLDRDPITVKEALESDNVENWKNAMLKEYSSLVENRTWSLVVPPKHRNVIGCKWVFTTKRDADGAVEKYKARLVAQGCFQKRNVDYFETFAPVIRHPTIRLILAIGVQKRLLIHHVDIAAAYLNGNLEEEVFMHQPDEFIDQSHPEKVCKLNRSIYGLKQAGRDWNRKINSILISIGFKRCKTDGCVYVLQKQEEVNIIGLYVDDLIIACSTQATLANIIRNLNRHVEAIDRGPIKFYLGMEIERDEPRGRIIVHQRRYVENLLIKWGMENCKPAFTPLASGTVLDKCSKEDCNVASTTLYQSLMGALNYLATISRPDLAHVISKLSQFNTHPHQEHFVAAKHVLRYLRNNSKVCLKFNNNDGLLCYTDADWGSDTTDRRSYSGYVVYFGGGPIAWESKKQNVTALSTMEAEYIAMCQGTKEVVFQRSLLMEMGFMSPDENATTLFCDNQGASFFAKNDVTHKRSKHIDIKYHYLKENCSKNTISIQYIPSNNNVADIFTKCLNKNKHIELVKNLFKN